MSYALPFIDNNGNSQQFGNEFDKMYNLELGQNMMTPQEPTVDYNTGMKYTLYDDTDGIYNQAKLFENNNDPQEDQQTTDEQAMERIRNTAGINRQLTESEKRFNLYTTNNFDIRFRNQLKSESEKAGDNIFSEFSQDHVNAVRNANENYIKEENLYETPETKQLNMLDKLSIGDSKSATNQALSALMGLAREEQKIQKRRQRFRERATGKTQETMTDKITKMTEGKPPVQSTPAKPETRMRGTPPVVPPKPRSRYEEVTWFL